MSSETIALIIKILPTVLFGTIVISTTIQSAIRGYRKSLIFFINYIISIVLGLAIFLIVSRNIDKMNLNTLWVNLGGYIGVDMLECETLFDAVEAILNTYIPAFSSLALNVNFQQLTIAIVGVVVNLVLGILFLIVFPLLVRLLL